MKYYHIRKNKNKRNDNIFWDGKILNLKYHKKCNGRLHNKELMHIDNFGIDKYTSDGKRTICIDCEKEYDEVGRIAFMKWFNSKKSSKTNSDKCKWDFSIVPTDIEGVDGYFDPSIGRGQWVIYKWPQHCSVTYKKLNWSMIANDVNKNRNN